MIDVGPRRPGQRPALGHVGSAGGRGAGWLPGPGRRHSPPLPQSSLALEFPFTDAANRQRFTFVA
jgi:hypothetical protein